MRWTGLGVARGTTLAGSNVATAGNGDTVTYGAAGASGGAVYAGRGYETWYPDANIRRIDSTLTSSKHAKQQITVTMRQAAPGTNNWPLVARSASASAAALGINPSGRAYIRLANGDLAGGTAVLSPVLPVNNKFLFDMITSLSATATTSNGRVIVRVTNLTDSTWNGNGVWYYDTGYTQDVGTANISVVRFGGNNGSWNQATPTLYEDLGWDLCDSSITSATTQSAVSPYFMPVPNTNSLPVVNAGADISIDPNIVDSFTLSGIATDTDGTIASYLWEDITSATTSVGTSANVTIPVTRSTQGATKTYRLTATDNLGGVGTDTVVVTQLPHTKWIRSGGAMLSVRKIIAGLDKVNTLSTPWLPFDMPQNTYFDDSSRVVFPHMMAATNLRRAIQDKNLDTDATAYENVYFMPPGAVEGSTDHRVYGGAYRIKALGRNPLGTDANGRDYRAQDWIAWFEMAKATGLRHIGVDVLSVSGGNADDAVRIVQAAAFTGMKVILMPDGDTLKSQTPTDAANHVASLIQISPSSIAKHTDGRYLISAYMPESIATAGATDGSNTVKNWWLTFISVLEAAGHPVAFWPCFQRAWTTANQWTAPTFTDGSFSQWLVGLGRWGVSDPDAVTNSATDRNTSVNTYGKPFMHTVRIEDTRPRLAVYWEAQGWNLWTTGMDVAHNNLNSASDIVQIATWNDYGENSAVSPNSAAGYTNLDVMSYDICKYRLGYTPPIVRDTLYMAHRLQFSPSGGTTTYTAGANYTSTMQFRGSTSDKDIVDVLVYATAPATVEITTSAGTTSTSVPAGRTRVSAPLALGGAKSISCVMKRGGATVSGTQITSPYAVESTRLVQDLSYRRMSSREAARGNWLYSTSGFTESPSGSGLYVPSTTENPSGSGLYNPV